MKDMRDCTGFRVAAEAGAIVIDLEGGASCLRRADGGEIGLLLGGATSSFRFREADAAQLGASILQAVAAIRGRGVRIDLYDEDDGLGPIPLHIGPEEQS